MLLPLRAAQEEKEEVKQMNQMIQFSKCMATRDQQVAEKAAAKAVAAQEERRVVEEMEQRRQAALEELEVGLGGVGRPPGDLLCPGMERPVSRESSRR